jgi:hypothetical protein
MSAKAHLDAEELQRLRVENQLLKENIERMQTKGEALDNKAAKDEPPAFDVKYEPTTTSIVRPTGTIYAAQMWREASARSNVLAQTNSRGPINPQPYILVALSALLIVYGIALVVFKSINAQNIEFAKDLIKTLTGFFIGIVTGLLGLST